MSDLNRIQAALSVLAKDMGRRAEVDLIIKPNEVFIYARPAGYGDGQPAIFGRGGNFDECLATASAQWEKMSSRVRRETIKKLALAVIRITSEQGQCTDAALRADFDAADIEQYGDEAVKLANGMAALGPFEIVTLAGANAA